MTGAVDRVCIEANRSFWAGVAARVDTWAPGGDALHVMLPSGAQARLLRAALVDRARTRQPFVGLLLPRISVWAQWASPKRDASLRRAQLFDALRTNAWIREHFGSSAQALWALAQQLEELAEALTYAAVAQPGLTRVHVEHTLKAYYRQRAAQVLWPQARLALDVWHAGGDVSASQRIERLMDWAERADAPLVFVEALDHAPWIDQVLTRYAQRAPVLRIAPSVASAIQAAPCLAAAWPELASSDEADADERVPIALRADGLAQQLAASPGEGAPPLPLTILEVTSLEDEAGAVAQQVLEALDQGAAQIGLVVLDRLTARRVRALLERAQVQVLDETGWKLSTSRAAAALMRCLDLFSDEFYWRDVLDWLKSSFTLAQRPDKAEQVAFLERAIRAGGAVQGAAAMRAALEAMVCEPGAQAARDGARQIVDLMQEQARAYRQAVGHSAASMTDHAQALTQALEALGMREPLAQDAAGRVLLAKLDALRAQPALAGIALSLSEFRAWWAMLSEELSFTPTPVRSPVLMMSLAAAPLRDLDWAILVGADADHLPVITDPAGFMNPAVRAQLGLDTPAHMLKAQAQQLALLILNTPHVVATWRAQRNGEPCGLSPLLERLRFVARRAGLGDVCTHALGRPRFDVTPMSMQRPAPQAGAWLPARMSTSQVQRLVACPYQFYAHAILGLSEQADLIEWPEKREFGQALHEVLLRFHRQWGDAPFHEHDREAILKSLRVHAHQVFAQQFERTPALLPFARRFDGLAPGYVAWLQAHGQQGWRWQAGELTRARALRLRDGRGMEVLGRIDRIDVHVDSGQLQVIDYKARAKDSLRQALKQPGEDVQLPLYMALVEGPVQAAAYLSFNRAKPGQTGVEEVALDASDDLSERVWQRLVRDVQRMADDHPLPATAVSSVCEHCDMRGLCRLDYWALADGEDWPRSAERIEGANE